MRPALRPGVRRCALAATLLVVAAFGARWLKPRLVFNSTASVPTGLYWRSLEPRALRRGGLVLVAMPDHLRELLQQRYVDGALVPEGLRELLRARYAGPALLLKPIAALAGDRICIQNGRLLVDGRDLGGICTEACPLPPVPICRSLSEHEIYLAATHARSLDSRYLGPVDMAALRGHVNPIFTW